MFGHLCALLVLMKGQPLAYNKDNQEDKEPLFDTVDTLARLPRRSWPTWSRTGSRRCPMRMRAAAREGFATATDLADYLVRKGLPFRDAHEAVARAVRDAEASGVDLADLSLADLKRCSPRVGADVHDVLTLEGSVASRDHPGGTAPRRVREAAAAARVAIAGAR